MRFDLRRADPHYLDKVSLHAVRAALAQIEIVFERAERIRIAFHPKGRFWVALDESSELLQLTDGAGLEYVAVVLEKLIVREAQFCA